jgi:DNA-binding transcriptional LysR family regulator
MEMHQVRYFLAVSDELNFTRAAERCNVAQPSLTRAIRLLEDELGGPLFHRERANTHLSELGRMMLPHLQQVYSKTIEAKQQAKDYVKLRVSNLRLGVMCTIPPGHLVDLVSAVQTKHEQVEFEIVDSSARILEERLVSGDLEVAIYANPANERDERLHHLPLFRERFVVALPTDHPLTSKNAIRPVDLQGVRYINRINCEYNGVAGPKWRECGLDWKSACRSERDDWVLAMVASGIGFSFLPEGCANHPGVAVRPMVEPEFWREVCLVTVRGRPHSPGVGALVREVSRARWPGKLARAGNGGGNGADEPGGAEEPGSPRH